MSNICDISKMVSPDVFGKHVEDMTFEASSDDECFICLDRFVIRLSQDPRDGVVISSIKFDDDPNGTFMLGHIVSKMFKLEWPKLVSQSDEKKIEEELRNVSELLDNINKKSVNYDILKAFYFGYNCGYTVGLNNSVN